MCHTAAFVSAVSAAGAGKVASCIQSMTGQTPLLVGTSEEADAPAYITTSTDVTVRRNPLNPFTPGQLQCRLPGARPALCSAVFLLLAVNQTGSIYILDKDARAS